MTMPIKRISIDPQMFKETTFLSEALNKNLKFTNKVAVLSPKLLGIYFRDINT